MKLQPVTLAQARALKELGFPQNDFKLLHDWYTGKVKDDAPSFPPLELVAKWLRKTKSCYICPIPEFYNWKDEMFSVWSINIHWEDNVDEYKALWNTYEEALSAGIDKAIEILKENETNNNN